MPPLARACVCVCVSLLFLSVSDGTKTSFIFTASVDCACGRRSLCFCVDCQRNYILECGVARGVQGPGWGRAMGKIEQWVVWRKS